MQNLDLFLFGAGASHGARPVDSPPLGATLHSYLLNYLYLPKAELGILEEPADGTRTDKTRSHLKQRLEATNSYEQLVDQLRQQGERDLLEKLNLLMAYTLTPPIKSDPKVDDAFVEKEDLYDRFLLKYFPGRETLQTACFITLNYDCLLERALCRCYHHPPDPKELRCLCSHIDYQLHPPSNDIPKIKVLKPHGSINWIADVTRGDQPHVQDPVVIIDQDDAEEWTRVNVVDSPQHKGHAKIAVAHYARKKEAQINADLFKAIRGLSLEQVERSTTITIIGIHIPNSPVDDPFLDDFFDLAKHRTQTGLPVYFVNNCDSELRKASSMRFIPKKCTFEEYVAQLNLE